MEEPVRTKKKWKSKEGGGEIHRGGRGSTLAARDPHGPSVNPRGHVMSIFGCISPKYTPKQGIIQQGVT